jgi:hypothetical protein
MTDKVTFLEGKGYRVEHRQYGDGRVLEVYKVRGITWITVRVNDNLVVSTPKTEWKTRDESQ